MCDYACAINLLLSLLLLLLFRSDDGIGMSDLIQEMYKWCSDRASPPSSQQLRFMSHLVLFFRALGITAKVRLHCTISRTYKLSVIRFITHANFILRCSWMLNGQQGGTCPCDDQEDVS